MHFFAIASPSNTCFAVQTVRQWKGGGAGNRKYGRLQLFRSDSGEELWRINHLLSSPNEVFPCDDFQHLVIVHSYIPQRSIEAQPVILFYSGGKLLKSYSLKDLNFDFGKLIKSVSHANFIEVHRVENAWAWEWPLGSEAAQIQIQTCVPNPNPHWQGNVFKLSMLDGQNLVFEAKTGDLIRTTHAH